VLTPAYDGNGNVVALFDQSTTATKVATHEYDAFGNDLASVFLASNAECKLNPIRFSTQYQDAETGFYNYGMRIYSPELGRFLSRDPLGEFAGPNPYAMVRNDPVNRVDRLGLFDVAGHFSTVYGLAISSGNYSAAGAFDLAYYAQLPDLVRWLDATQLALYKLPPFTRRLKLSDSAIAEMDLALLGQNTWTWTQDVQNWIHSLSGAAGQQEVLQRQCCLSDMLRSGSVGGKPMNLWERGFVIHALGDAYAHTAFDARGLYSNGGYGGADMSPLGHGFEANTPDIIGERLIPYHRYVVNLFDVLGGTDRGLRDNVETLGIGTTGLTNDQANEQMLGLIKANPAFDWIHNGNSNFDPNKPFSTLPNHYTPSAGEVRNLMDRMKKHCSTIK
jgi:RHS repeat-associated protein